MEPFRDPSLGTEARVRDLIARMSPEERIAQLHAVWLILSEDGDHRPREDGFAGSDGEGVVERAIRLGVGQVTRPLGTRGIDPAAGVRALNRLQRDVIEGSRHGIPVMAHEECLSGLMARGATLFPSGLSYGATWNPELVERAAGAIGAECLSVGCRQGLAPVLDVIRDARWGRTEECFAEDPWLAGLMASAYVRGIQGPGPNGDRRMLATLKHFAGHAASEGARNHAPVHMGPNALADTHLLPFEMAVRMADAGSVMPAYHDIDGMPLHADRHLLTEVLREAWGFDGLIVADYIGVTLLHEHHGVSDGPAASAAMAVRAGLDVELPGADCVPSLSEALDRGLIDMEEIDAACARVLTEKIRLGLFENPYADEGAIALRSPEALGLAHEVAAQSVTLLSNDGTLPVRPDARLAVIGPTADDPLALLGDYSFPVHLVSQGDEAADAVVTILNGLREVHPSVAYARGCHVIKERGAGTPVFPGDIEDSTSLTIGDTLSADLSLIPEAAEAARAADVALVCVGDLSGIFQTGTVGEGSDADSLDLPGVQQALLDAVLGTGTPTVVLLTSGRPYRLGGRERDLAAYVMAYLPGERGGTAIAEVLTGAREPSGRLTLSVPRSAGAAPYYYNHSFKSPGTPVARHFGTEFPFGHGLGYTRFAFADLDVPEAVSADGTVPVSFEVTNAGDRPGVAIPQLYLRDRLASRVRPVKELKGFARLELAPGESARVTLELPMDLLAFSTPSGRMLEPGAFDVMVGASSGDIALRGTVEVTGEPRRIEGAWRVETAARVERRR